MAFDSKYVARDNLPWGAGKPARSQASSKLLKVAGSIVPRYENKSKREERKRIKLEGRRTVEQRNGELLHLSVDELDSNRLPDKHFALKMIPQQASKSAAAKGISLEHTVFVKSTF
ncbi:hypothetical protein CIRG_09931 [Coccidioides immitis RMSCC 2394]|uniref:Uncharacterized protein n=1 Tax=Coccidioides immitis RMSCC 2394 TaxID=404692 RepID=A0A0J6YR16_COCIT|nr:hypothetical protein CIRG_09931 [Coccidioides immitis RMSCC 2394]